MDDKKIDIEFKSFIISFIYLIIFVLLLIPQGIYGYVLFVLSSIISIMANIILKKKIDRKYSDSINKKVNYDYWREVNFNHITAVEAGAILGVEKIGINTFVVILFELKRKQIFNIENIDGKYYISLKTSDLEKINSLKYYEQNIVKMLFTGTDDKSKIELKQVIELIKNNSEKKVYIDRTYKYIENEIKNKYYTSYMNNITKYSKNYLFALIILNVVIMNIFIGVVYFISLISALSIAIIPIIISIILQLIVAININTGAYIKKEYIDEVNKLNGLYNYINDFSNIEEKELKYYELYKEYFLYAVSMGIAEKFELDLGYNEITNDLKANIEFLFAYKKEYI